MDTPAGPRPARWRGVNLGGWLVLEKWMTPSLFEGLAATDETRWCVELGAAAAPRLRAHWRDFIGHADFEWIAACGLNAVRIPVGHWILGPPYPAHPSYDGSPAPFVTGGIDVLDQAMDWAAAAGLQVLIDLHAAPGCQNGFDNGGLLGICDWASRAEYLDHSVELLGRLARRYRSHPALGGIEVLNEPRWDVPTGLLADYYRRAHAAIRAEIPDPAVAVVFHDGFRPAPQFRPLLDPADTPGAVWDIHRYQCFERADLDLDVHGHLVKTATEWAGDVRRLPGETGLPLIVGEWSLGLDLKVVSLWAPGPYDHALDPLDRLQHDAALRAYGAAQLLAFEPSRGWFFWSYRTETTPAWCFRDCVARGWLPARYD